MILNLPHEGSKKYREKFLDWLFYFVYVWSSSQKVCIILISRSPKGTKKVTWIACDREGIWRENSRLLRLIMYSSEPVEWPWILFAFFEKNRHSWSSRQILRGAWQALILTVADGDFVLKMVSRILPKNPCESKNSTRYCEAPVVSELCRIVVFKRTLISLFVLWTQNTGLGRSHEKYDS